MADLPAAIPARRKIVVVEDDAETRELEMFLLASEGYQAVGVADGEEAAATVRREAADLVILDLMLPRKDGLQVLAELEADRATSGIPVIVVSAWVSALGGQGALRQRRQVKRVLEKPLDIAVLLAVVERELEPVA